MLRALLRLWKAIMVYIKNTWANGDAYAHTDQNNVGTAFNTIVDGATGTNVDTLRTTTSTTYADITDTTDTVTVTVGPSGKVRVEISANISNNTLAATGYVSFLVSGANTLAADDSRALWSTAQAAGYFIQFGTTIGLGVDGTPLNPGSTTFKMKYKVSTGTGTFLNRRILVEPL